MDALKVNHERELPEDALYWRAKHDEALKRIVTMRNLLEDIQAFLAIWGVDMPRSLERRARFVERIAAVLSSDSRRGPGRR